MTFSKCQKLFFFLLLVPFLPIATFGLDQVLYQYCDKNFTRNDLLQSNINSLVMDMKKMVSTHGFAISTSGSSYEAVYGVARCQDDMSHEECSVCIIDAVEKVRAACPGSAKARVWQEKCFIHYDTDNFLGKADQSYASVWWSAYEAKNPEVFEHGVAELMAEVMASAAGGRRRFSTGENLVKGYDSMTIYGMAQCTQDLDESACSQCMENSLEIMTNYCGCHLGCRIFGSSCVLRYEIYKFFGNIEIDAPTPAPSVAVYY